MPSSPQETFFAELSEIKEKANEIYNSQGFLTDSDVKSVWSEEHFDHILSPNTLLGFPEDHSKDSKVSFLRLRFKILLTLIEIGWLQWNKCYPNLYSDKRNDEALPLARNDLNFLTPSLYDAFQKRQWRFNPPQLKEHGIVKKYDRGTKLPFMKASGETIGSGESGDVTRETVPAGYWKDHNGFLNTVRECWSLVLEALS